MSGNKKPTYKWYTGKLRNSRMTSMIPEVRLWLYLLNSCFLCYWFYCKKNAVSVNYREGNKEISKLASSAPRRKLIKITAGTISKEKSFKNQRLQRAQWCQSSWGVHSPRKIMTTVANYQALYSYLGLLALWQSNINSLQKNIKSVCFLFTA